MNRSQNSSFIERRWQQIVASPTDHFVPQAVVDAFRQENHVKRLTGSEDHLKHIAPVGAGNRMVADGDLGLTLVENMAGFGAGADQMEGPVVLFGDAQQQLPVFACFESGQRS